MVTNDELLEYFLFHIAQSANAHHLFVKLAQQLIRLADHAFSLRQVSTLEEASLVLMNLPIDNAREIGLYYRALALSRNRKKNEALAILEKVADKTSHTYNVRILHTLGSIHQGEGRLDEALQFYAEANRVASPKNRNDLLTTLMVSLNLSFIKSNTGDHHGALCDLENLSPIVPIVATQSPLSYYLFHADLAYELAQVGRLAEAEAACSIALASPFAHAYPEWSETRDEIAAKRLSASPSVVAVSRKPEADLSQKPEPQQKPEPVRARTLIRPAREEDSVQTSLIPIAADAAIAHKGISQSILDWMCKCIGPRAPPALS